MEAMAITSESYQVLLWFAANRISGISYTIPGNHEGALL